MKLAHISEGLSPRYRETCDHADNLERAISHGHVRRNMAEVELMRSRHPALAAGARAVLLIDLWRDRLPQEFIADVEADPAGGDRQ